MNPIRLVIALLLIPNLQAQTPDDLNPIIMGPAFAIAIQPDGKILMGGYFSTVDGVERNHLARLNADGTLDATFNPNVNQPVNCLAVQADGKIIIGGDFTYVGGVWRDHIARLNPNGSLDETFNPEVDYGISCMAVQPDGKILLCGGFGSVGGVERTFIARLNTNGTLDGTFNVNVDNWINTIALQSDGKILIGGLFATVGGAMRVGIARLNANGTLDSAFNPGTDNTVFTIAAQADGKILVGGEFSAVGGAMRNCLARLNANGTLDGAFDPNVQNPDDLALVYSLCLQADGKILLGGIFSSVGGISRNGMARLNANGSLDGTFDPRTDPAVDSIALQTDGKILTGGTFFTMGGKNRYGIARLSNNVASTSTLIVTGTSQVDWTRGGSAPEVSQVTFERWNGSAWTKLGNATRVTVGWRMTGLSLAGTGQIRARGRTIGGQHNGSSWVIEQTATYGAPDISLETQPSTILADGSAYDFGMRTTSSATPVSFILRNTGSLPLTLGTLGIGRTNADEFAISTAGMASTVPPGGQTTFQVSFIPISAGSKFAVLSIYSDDPDENPFSITLKGKGNTVPYYTGFTGATPYQFSAMIAFRKLLAKASDPDGDAISITAAGPVSANGGAVVLLADAVRYTPPNGFSGTDTFSIVLTDSGGASITGTVTVQVGSAPNVGTPGANANPPKLTNLPGGKMGLSFQGIPGRSYLVQRSAGGLDDWQTLATVIADATGKISYTDENPPPGSAFYRLGAP
ncbi:MAG: choice-of-anchor D domain-containing protein [Verrucomicrobia bacterium]|nr:choice-of-anchor D domain-containing protein [Verrucomicrobiota bacterium]